MLDFRAFNDLKIAYYISTISSMFLLLIVLRLIFSSLILAIVFALFFGLIISIIFTFIGNSRIKKIIKDLENNCNALAFLNSFTAIADRLNKPNNLVYINLGTGYFYIGDFEKAYSILKLVNFKKINNIIDASAAVSYYYALFATCVKLDKREEAERAMNSILEISDISIVKTPYKEFFKNYYTHCSMTYNSKYKGLVLTEDYLISELKAEKSLINKVSYNFLLAEFYEQNGEIDKAKECYKFVEQKGGTTYFVPIAKEKLNVLGL